MRSSAPRSGYRPSARPHCRDASASLEQSLARLRLDHVDIFHLHNPITDAGGGSTLSARQCWMTWCRRSSACVHREKFVSSGFAVGDTAALHQVIDSGAFDSAQIVYNMLNPSAGEKLPKRLSGTGLWAVVRFPQSGRDWRRRHSRAGGWRLVWLQPSVTPLRSGARADRLGHEL